MYALALGLAAIITVWAACAVSYHYGKQAGAKSVIDLAGHVITAHPNADMSPPELVKTRDMSFINPCTCDSCIQARAGNFMVQSTATGAPAYEWTARPGS